MKAAELAALLMKHPEANVNYRDMNYGNIEDEFTAADLQYTDESGFLVASRRFEDPE